MHHFNPIFRVFHLLTVLALVNIGAQAQSNQKPNIIYILADDLGYGDLSCYGQQKFSTPNIDKLAKQGIRFTQHYSGSSVCAPSRSSLMTGQHTGHTPIRGNKEAKPEGQVPLPGKAETIAEVLQRAGYATGAFGKWGLGFIGTEGDPNQQGFDEFYGYNCQRQAHRYFPTYLWHNQEKDFLKGNDYTNKVTYAPDMIQEATLQFITNHKDKPFFAYVPFVLPHAEIISPNDSVYQKYKGQFKEDKPFVMPESYLSDYGPDIQLEKYASQTEPHAVYATMVSRLDLYVGQIMDKLNELGIADNTLVIFTSDNGPAQEGGSDPEFFNGAGGLRGVKRDLYEGGIRCPFIAVWPNQIKPNTVSDHISAFWDMKPTFADMAGVKKVSTDGLSILPTLTGKGRQKKHDHLYWEFPANGGRKAVRMGQWKGVVYDYDKTGDTKLELYNLSVDEAEKNNIASAHPDIVKKVKEIMRNEHQHSTLFPMP
ncbi:arylsulfatase A-like enzyme [Dyadobacter jejuensis]|uniref:Arylsulfatase A-like enzyme n=1 Tax=Dyadobacter jejuensis TaxID=1082580 RepID=A0A316AJX7_9BACT|nr:arylsulfatase [Dyadobacter jejuensis]PWJ57966.1 arylsulfatase A-like enzyme [Dyadobacter jejuensis]